VARSCTVPLWRFRWRHSPQPELELPFLGGSNRICRCGVRRGSSCPDVQPGQHCRLASLGVDYSPNIRVFTRPRTEGLELALGLAHPCAEEVEFPQGLCTGLSIAVDWVKSIGRRESPKTKGRGVVRLAVTLETVVRTSCDVRRSRQRCAFQRL
jgi:hypothetical protein